MDQIVVHLSINHATLPRIQNFLANLQLGPISVHVPASSHSDEQSKHQSAVHKLDPTSPTSQRAWNAICNHFTGTVSVPSISEQPLRYQQERGGIELSTIVYSDKGEQLEQRNAENGRSEATSLSDEGLSRERSSGQRGRVRVQKDIL
jgi:hypothetical protein